MKNYKVKGLNSDLLFGVYERHPFSPEIISDEHLFLGSAADCYAYIKLKEEGYL